MREMSVDGDVLVWLSNCLDKDVEIEQDQVGAITVKTDAKRVTSVLRSLRDDHQLLLGQLLDVVAVDYPHREKRFELIYLLLSMQSNVRVRVRIQVGEDEFVPSAVHVFPAANWYEREIFDMYGVEFTDHPDLRRILTDYGFRGYPLRKDFPLTGHVEVRYDDLEKRVVYEPVTLVQEYRSFDYLSSWESMTPTKLPGDEKASGNGESHG